MAAKDTPSAEERSRIIQAVVFDVDGVLTDGSIYLDSRGQETKRFDVQDGQGISLLAKSGFSVCFLSGRNSPSVDARAKELGVAYVYQGVRDKVESYEDLKRLTSLNDGNMAYLGDDLPDIPVMMRVGIAAAVANAREEVKGVADYVCKCEGGKGAAREFAEWLLRGADKWKAVLERYSLNAGAGREQA